MPLFSSPSLQTRRIVAALRLLKKDERAYCHLVRCMSGVYDYVQLERIQPDWLRLNRPFAAKVLARSPVFGPCPLRFLERTHLGLVARMDRLVTHQSGCDGDVLELYAVQENLDASIVVQWAKDFTPRYARAHWASLPQGWTPLVGNCASVHLAIEAFEDWFDLSQDLRGWSGTVRTFPRAISLDPANPNGFGSCMIAIRQDNLLALVVAAR